MLIRFILIRVIRYDGSAEEEAKVMIGKSCCFKLNVLSSDRLSIYRS
jgi:hypothetical protein